MANILVVEDTTTTQRLLEFILQVGGHTVTSAFNGVEALDKLARGMYDLLIVDVAMPMMDGLTLLRELRANTHYTNLPIIMLTASAEDRLKTEALADGANIFLTKPISSTELSEVVNSLLNV